ncbi:RagB/SusD family nutrient uptake outer membrane protein [Olivibacter ginsenosidimutans]|uniref:RagB/SusD family nutrient uptake outer membrane protein n=1 Tax=Olivibacter ginsenosidimutans TaxID=1176537 RepID=A0ABP9BQZ7_9SPHI
MIIANIKKITLCTFMLLLGALYSCQDDFLDRVPSDKLNDENSYQDESGFEKGLIGSYSRLRALYTKSSLLYAAELITDNAEIKFQSPSNDEQQYDQVALNPANGLVNEFWTNCLLTIANCNIILNKINGVDFDETAKNRITGEAKFLRAFCYFYLVQLYGNVPLVTQSFNSPEEVYNADLTLKPSSDVYPFIVEDLQSAESLMPGELNTDKTRASLGTVKAVLGKVYLAMHDYDQAATKLKEVIDLNQYQLVSDYGSLFSAGNNNKEESMLEVQFLSGQTIGNNFSALFTPPNLNTTLFPNNQQGSGRIVPTLDMMNTYETGDKRKEASVGDTVTLADGSNVYARYGKKFVDWKATDLEDGSVTFTILRYADVLLSYAEALNEQGNTADALTYINQVRERASLPDLSGLTQDACRLALEKERRVEFFDEGDRWFDLVRTGRAQEVMNAYFENLKLNFSVEDHELIFPIPFSEIQNNPEIKQNPGY